MEQLERQQARQWLEELAEALEPWRLVIVSGNDLFAGVMVWTYPGEMRRAGSLAALQALLAAPEACTPQELLLTPSTPTAPTAAVTGGPAGARRPVPQRLLPVRSDSPGCLDPQADLLFFLLCDDLPDGELEQAVLLLQDLPAERRRVLAVLADQSDQQRLQRLLELGLDGLCSQNSCGQGRIYTAVDAIASGGSYIEPQFRQRLLPTSGAEAPDAPPAPAAAPLAPEDLSRHERELLRELCLGFNSQEIASHRGMTYQSVRRTLSQTYQRLGVRDRAQAIGWCVAHNLIPLEDLQRHYGARGPFALG